MRFARLQAAGASFMIVYQLQLEERDKRIREESLRTDSESSTQLQSSVATATEDDTKNDAQPETESDPNNETLNR